MDVVLCHPVNDGPIDFISIKDFSYVLHASDNFHH